MKKAMKQSKMVFLLNLSSVVLLVIALTLLGLTIIQNKAADEANEERFNLTEQATRLMNASSYLTSEVRAYAATGDLKHYTNYMKELNETKTREVSIGAMKKIGIAADEQAIIDEMFALSNKLLPQEEQAMQRAAAGDYLEAAKSVLVSPYNNTITDISVLKSSFLDLLTQRTGDMVSRLVKGARALESLAVFFGVAVIVLQLVSYRVIRKKVIQPIIILEQEMHRVAAGDLVSRPVLTPDTSEIGMLIDSLRTTKESLRRYIQDISEKLGRMANRDLSVCVDIEYIGDFAPIKESMQSIIGALNTAFYRFDRTADQVAGGALQVAGGAQSLALGSEQQSTSIEQISTAIYEITDQIKTTADRSKMASDLATNAGMELNKSNEQLQGMLKAMNEISNASDEIGKIIKTIEDIAFQTNILALNAAVEAARAGEAGRGFAVVADEVRNLATKSAEASKTSSEMIENSLDTIKSGAKIAKAASSTFVYVMINAGKATEAMVSITEDTKIQVQAVMEINQNIAQIAEVVQNNSAASEEAATSAEQLSSQAEELRRQVRQFTLLAGANES